MREGDFSFEVDPLKHHVRYRGWLPYCKRRRQSINHGKERHEWRRLRYFTFCAVGAVDVLMLDVERVLRPAKGPHFDTVFFFNKDARTVLETNRRIPGATGFAGDFVSLVLMEDPEEEREVERNSSLEPPEEEEDLETVRKVQRRLDIRRKFIRAFPFDVINLDLEGFPFRPTDELPGNVLRALKKVVGWQRRAGEHGRVDEFTLMFTTKVGPRDMPDSYRDMLTQAVTTNIEDNPELAEIMDSQTGYSSAGLLFGEAFEAFFKLALPKLILGILLDEDWYPDPDTGVAIYEFERPHDTGTYSILHLVLDVKRQRPPSDRRAPLSRPREAAAGYKDVVERVFCESPILVTPENIDAEALAAHLEKILARRRKYCPDCE